MRMLTQSEPRFNRCNIIRFNVNTTSVNINSLEATCYVYRSVNTWLVRKADGGFHESPPQNEYIRVTYAQVE